MKQEIKDFLIFELNIEGSLTNFHLNGVLLEFSERFCHEDMKLNNVKRKFTRCCKELEDLGLVFPAERLGTGYGGVSDFGCNTQTIWRKRIYDPKDDEKIPGLSYSRNEFKYFKKHGRFPKTNIKG